MTRLKKDKGLPIIRDVNSLWVGQGFLIFLTLFLKLFAGLQGSKQSN